MARLERGENIKIDHINDLVVIAKTCGDKDMVNDALTELLDVFKPLLLRICTKWSTYFNDSKHTLIQFDSLMSDCLFWFSHYTLCVYTIDGRATYNKFIKDHIDQRIRYIYECQLRYAKKNLMPNPFDDNQNPSDAFDQVLTRYSSANSDGDSLFNDLDDRTTELNTSKLVDHIFQMLECDAFSPRERDIFKQVTYNGVTHEKLGEQYGISRTRVTQILAKSKEKLYKKIEEDAEIWQLLDDADIDITNSKLMG